MEDLIIFLLAGAVVLLVPAACVALWVAVASAGSRVEDDGYQPQPGNPVSRNQGVVTEGETIHDPWMYYDNMKERWRVVQKEVAGLEWIDEADRIWAAPNRGARAGSGRKQA